MNTDPGKLAAMQRDLAIAMRHAPLGTTWKHARTGGTYKVIGHCVLESNGLAAVIYRDTAGGPPWARRADEFMDGRFLRLTRAARQVADDWVGVTG